MLDVRAVEGTGKRRAVEALAAFGPVSSGIERFLCAWQHAVMITVLLHHWGGFRVVLPCTGACVEETLEAYSSRFQLCPVKAGRLDKECPSEAAAPDCFYAFCCGIDAALPARLFALVMCFALRDTRARPVLEIGEPLQGRLASVIDAGIETISLLLPVARPPTREFLLLKPLRFPISRPWRHAKIISGRRMVGKVSVDKAETGLTVPFPP